MTKRTAPSALLNAKTPVDWCFLFKLNSSEEMGDPKPAGGQGQFDVKGWKRPPYASNVKKYSQHYLFASSRNPALAHGKSILGATPYDPLGSMASQVYFGSYHYVVWNDQFYGDPLNNREAPWGHSKGIVAWNNEGEGLVMQVSTPSWPASGSSKHPRKTDGNTLGSVRDDNIAVSQHFFALNLNREDLLILLRAMKHSNVVTVPKKKQVFNIGGPAEIQAAAMELGKLRKGKVCTNEVLSSGVRLISKPSKLHVPPWHMVSAELGGANLRVACWWDDPRIYSTTRTSRVPGCWSDSLGKPGAVKIALSGTWHEKKGHKVKNLGLTGGVGANHNHAKFGVSTSKGTSYTIFGDMNQQGALWKGYNDESQECDSSQNGRGGMFFVMDDKILHQSMNSLLKGKTAPSRQPPKKKRK